MKDQNYLFVLEYFLVNKQTNDNLIFYKKIIQYSKDALNSDGVLYLECHTDRINFVKNILKINDFKNIKIKEDLFGRKRMIKACI